jgi:hypothetical protein
MRADGTILDCPGFDEASGIYYKHRGVEFPPIPDSPTKDDAKAALQLLKNLVRDFPFVDNKEDDGESPTASRSVFLAALLTTVHRPALAHSPLFGFTATTAGTGKSKLVETISVMQAGDVAPVDSPGGSEEQVE